MAHRLGIFLAAIFAFIGLLVCRPWFHDTSFVGNAQWWLFGIFLIISGLIYVFIRGIGWVFTGR